MEEKHNGFNFKLLLQAGIGVVLLFVIILLLNYINVISLGEIFYPGSSSRQAAINKDKYSTKIIARAGIEDIYQKDLDTEIFYAPPQKSIDMKKELLKKLINDSIILQGAADDKLITLDETVFNSVNKDYAKRIAKVREAENKVNAQAGSIRGTVITIWFYNNDYVGPLGYEKSKELAYQKIFQLHSDVKARKKTIQEAAEAIRNDNTLDQLDLAYKTNASFYFNLKSGEGATFDDNFNKVIWQLSKGELSDIYALADKDTELGKVEVLYAFAQASDKITKGKGSSFDDWLKGKKKNYAISYW